MCHALSYFISSLLKNTVQMLFAQCDFFRFADFPWLFYFWMVDLEQKNALSPEKRIFESCLIFYEKNFILFIWE